MYNTYLYYWELYTEKITVFVKIILIFKHAYVILID